MPSEIKRLFYLSHRRDVDDASIERMVAHSAIRNANDGLTGALLFDGQHFVQMLEGEHDPLARCFLRIARSPLHHQIEIGAFAGSAGRLFMGWSMQAFPVPGQGRPLLRIWKRIAKEPEELRMIRLEAAFLEWTLPKS